jgi:preprotein translocase subunit YajC
VGYLIILVALFGLMWLLLIRPQRKRQLQQSEMLGSLEPGAEVLSAGGIHGTVKAIDGEIVHLEIAPGTTVRLDRRAVATVVQDTRPEPEAEAEAEAETESVSPVSPDGS